MLNFFDITDGYDEIPSHHRANADDGSYYISEHPLNTHHQHHYETSL